MATSTIASASRTPASAVTPLPKATTQGPPTPEPSRARGPRVGRRRAEPGVLPRLHWCLISCHTVFSVNSAANSVLSVTVQRLIKPVITSEAIRPDRRCMIRTGYRTDNMSAQRFSQWSLAVLQQKNQIGPKSIFPIDHNTKTNKGLLNG